MSEGASLEPRPIPAADSPILEEIVRRLVEIYHPERIYLFGSVARGDARADSDYDIMVVVPDDTPREVIMSKGIYEILWRIGTSADLHVYTRQDFDKRLHLKASFPSTIVREGKLLYDARPGSRGGHQGVAPSRAG
jgi:predicted nucleotidyltransferase